MIPLEYKKYFWDCDFNSINFEQHKVYIVERILNFGNFESLNWLKNRVGKNELFELIKNSRNLDAKTKNYWEIISKNDKI